VTKKSMSDDLSDKRYDEALAFAAEKHSAIRQARKGTSFPYVVHPIRVAQILDRFGYPSEVVVAGLLHDTVEDAGVTYEELSIRFGTRVEELVRKASEPDKSLDWRVRKRHTIDRVGLETDRDPLALIAADKLDNVRSLADTLRALGEKKTWGIFNAGRKDQRWYYRELTKALLRRDPNSLLFRTLDAEVQEVFPDERRPTCFFGGKSLGNPHDARAYLADPIKHWRPDYSAQELARAWLGASSTPQSVHNLLTKALGAYDIVEGFFEKETELGTRGRPSQTDLLLVLRSGSDYAVVAIEAKAREPFGPIVEKWNDGSAGKQARLNDLCHQLGLRPAAVRNLRYQLLHRTAAALIEAKRYGAPLALLVVQAFPGAQKSLTDFQEFARALGLGDVAQDELSDGKPIRGCTLRLGWASTTS
jgi:hypothetical protein